jgi:glycine betaine transporter
MAADDGARLFRVALVFCVVVAVFGIATPDAMADAAKLLTGTAFRALDWFFMITVTALLLLGMWLAIGPYGHLKLGKDDEQPEFSTPSWLAMLFSAGMGVGLLFWGAAEPMLHFQSPPIGEGGTPSAARQAMVITNFHWGFHAWACYALGALVLAYFGFRRGEPYLAGSPIRAAFKGRWVEPVAWSADLIAVLAVVFGVAGSVGMGVLQLHTGLHVVAGVPLESTGVALAILVAICVSYMASAATSLDKGIKWLSNINMTLAILLMVFILFAGPTPFLLRNFVTVVSDYTSSLVGLSLRLYPYAGVNSWMEAWTLTYFIWWIAWAPFVGIFIARISRGRTIRQFVTGVIVAPTLFSMLWFAIFGGMGFHEEMYGAGGIARLVNENVTVALFALLDRLPLSTLLAVITNILVFIFLVTSVDSATFVLGMLTSKGSVNPPTRRKLAWGVIMGALGGSLVLSGEIHAVRAVAVSGAIPFTFILLIQIAAVLRALRQERVHWVTEGESPPGASHTEPVPEPAAAAAAAATPEHAGHVEPDDGRPTVQEGPPPGSIQPEGAS